MKEKQDKNKTKPKVKENKKNIQNDKETNKSREGKEKRK